MALYNHNRGKMTLFTPTYEDKQIKAIKNSMIQKDLIIRPNTIHFDRLRIKMIKELQR